MLEDAENTEDQLRMMEVWFRDNYEDPAERTPYESAEGGYIWIWGGPYNAHDVLQNEFGGSIPDALIERLADELSGECPEWAPIPSEDDYDQSLFEVVSANEDALHTFEEAISAIEGLLSQSVDVPLAQSLYRLLYANVVTALETYLSDTFINTVMANQRLMRRFVETTPEFGKRTVPYNSVLRHAEEVPTEVKRYLLDVVWHNLAKVQAMYRDTLEIDFGATIKNVARAIPVRHDIVHRNGKRKDGMPVFVSVAEVEQLIHHVRELVTAIDAEYRLHEYELDAEDHHPDF
jgi:hypothetical protein